MVGSGAMPSSVVVVGASLAGFRTARALRQRGFAGRLTLVGDEQHLPYERPPLSKQVLTGKWPADRAALADDAAIAALDIELRTGVAAVAALPGRVLCSDGTEHRYDVLVVATGAAPRSLPDQPVHPRVHLLRRLEDSAALAAHLASAGTLLVVGGGLIGGEVAAAARTSGVDVTVVEALDIPFARSLGADAGARLAELHRAHGVTLRTNTTVQEWRTTDDGVGVALSDGSDLQADVALVGIGVRPNTHWLGSSGLELTDGVPCDPYGRVLGLEGTFAVGDVAAWQDVRSGKRRRSEHWTSAVEQAETVADVVMGIEPPDPALRVPYVWTDQYATKVQVLGESPPGGTTVELTSGGDQLNGTSLGCFEDDRLVGVTVFGAPKLLNRYRPLVAERGDRAATLAAAAAFGQG